MPNLPYDPFTDFVPLVGVNKTSLYFHVSPSVHFKSLAEFVEDARKNPGKYTVSSGSTTMLMAGEMLNQAAGIKLLAVPFKNATDAVTAVASGQVDLVIVDAAMASPYYSRGVRALATTTPARTKRYPELPTAKEEGVPGYQVVGWFGTYFPAHTPPAISAAMRDLLANALKTKYVTDVLSNFAMEPFDGDLAAWEREDYERWGKAVRAANMGPKK
jgi:tripartite-type tricarboxylate transporter receptor subunit TctC